MARPDDYGTALGISRMLELLGKAPGGERGVNELAEAIGVHRKTITRWARALEERLEGPDGGPVVVYQRGTPQRPAVVRRPGRHQPSKSEQSAAAIAFAAGRYLLATGAQPLAEHLERLAGVTNPEQRRRLQTAFHYIPFGAKSYDDLEDQVDAVFSGVLYRHTLTFEYRLVVRGTYIPVRAEPWSMVFYRDALYMLGRRLSHGEPAMRVYAVDRMTDVHRDHRAKFQIPDDFDPADHFGDLGIWPAEEEPQRMEVLFDPKTAVFVRERSWPGFVEWADYPDGRKKLVLQIRISVEVEEWLASFGARVEVLSPLWLRASFKKRADAMMDRYATPLSSTFLGSG